MAIDVVARSLRQFRDFVWPARCLGCDCRLIGEQQLVCGSCRPLARRVSDPACPTCALPLPFESSEAEAPCQSCRRNPPPQRAGFAYWIYDGAISRAIQGAKYAGEAWRLHALGSAMRDWFARLARELRPDAPRTSLRLATVPMHRRRLRERGFDAAVQLARAAASAAPTWLERRWNALERPNPTRPQAGLTRGERRRNVRGVFSVPEPDLVSGDDWLVFDDVSTTGATLAEAAATLADAGARRVYTLAAARTPPDTYLADP